MKTINKQSTTIQFDTKVNEDKPLTLLNPYEKEFKAKQVAWSKNEIRKIDNKYQKMNYQALSFKKQEIKNDEYAFASSIKFDN